MHKRSGAVVYGPHYGKENAGLGGTGSQDVAEGRKSWTRPSFWGLPSSSIQNSSWNVLACLGYHASSFHQTFTKEASWAKCLLHVGIREMTVSVSQSHFPSGLTLGKAEWFENEERAMRRKRVQLPHPHPSHELVPGGSG